MANRNFFYRKERRCRTNCAYLQCDGSGYGFYCSAKGKKLKDRRTRNGEYIPLELPHCHDYTIVKSRRLER